MTTTRQLLNSLRDLLGECKEIGTIYSKTKNDFVFKNIGTTVFDILVEDKGLIDKTRSLFISGHHKHAVEEAFKYVDNVVKRRSGVQETGAKLMTEVFKPANPVLKFNGNCSQSEKDEQLGLMELLQGSMIGIRNPRAHESDWEDSERTALRLIGLADYLLWKIINAKK